MTSVKAYGLWVVNRIRSAILILVLMEYISFIWIVVLQKNIWNSRKKIFFWNI